MQRRYITVDVFTDRAFGGNPLAVVLDAGGLSTAQMQAVACEFNYAETTFVLPPRDAANDAQVRIFTPKQEVPFAGHPNVGTAYVLASRAAKPPARLKFEEGAGLVLVDILQEAGSVVGAELTAPQTLSKLSQFSAGQAAECGSLSAADIRTDRHPPQIVSVGMPFLVAELNSRDALRRARPDAAAFARLCHATAPLRSTSIQATCRQPSSRSTCRRGCSFPGRAALSRIPPPAAPRWRRPRCSRTSTANAPAN